MCQRCRHCNDLDGDHMTTTATVINGSSVVFTFPMTYSEIPDQLYLDAINQIENLDKKTESEDSA